MTSTLLPPSVFPILHCFEAEVKYCLLRWCSWRSMSYRIKRLIEIPAEPLTTCWTFGNLLNPQEAFFLMWADGHSHTDASPFILLHFLTDTFLNKLPQMCWWFCMKSSLFLAYRYSLCPNDSSSFAGFIKFYWIIAYIENSTQLTNIQLNGFSWTNQTHIN